MRENSKTANAGSRACSPLDQKSPSLIAVAGGQPKTRLKSSKGGLHRAGAAAPSPGDPLLGTGDIDPVAQQLSPNPLIGCTLALRATTANPPPLRLLTNHY